MTGTVLGAYSMRIYIDRTLEEFCKMLLRDGIPSKGWQ